MTEVEKQKLVAMADVLLSTLGDMSAKDADRTVRLCVNAIYNDLLDTPGKVQSTGVRFCYVGGTSVLIRHSFIPSEANK